MVGYVKDNFFTRYRKFDSLAHVNQLLEQWLVKVADQRMLRQFGQTPAGRFTEEKKALLSVPVAPFDTSYFDIRQVAWDGYIEVRGNRYSVPDAWCGKPVIIRITLDDELRVWGEGQLIATHALMTGSPGWQTVPEHHTVLWQQTCRVEQRPLSVYEGLLNE